MILLYELDIHLRIITITTTRNNNSHHILAKDIDIHHPVLTWTWIEIENSIFPPLVLLAAGVSSPAVLLLQVGGDTHLLLTHMKDLLHLLPRYMNTAGEERSLPALWTADPISVRE
jgi:hypothetical protein